MLDPKLITDKTAEVKAALKFRVDEALIDKAAELYARRNELLTRVDAMRADLNRCNEEMKKFASQKTPEAKAAMEERRASMKELSGRAKEAEPELKRLEEEFYEVVMQIPNVPKPDVKQAKDESENVEVRRWGEPRKFDFPVKDHGELGTKLGILDFERAAKISGARFVVYMREGARLEHALIQFMLSEHVKRGYDEVIPPFLVSRKTMTGTGQLPKFEEDLFKTSGEKELFLIPTAEVPVTNLYADEIIPGEKLPLRFAAFSSCFRAEAGSYGRDVSGIIRQHQFQKVEMVKFCRPEESENELQLMVSDAENILQKLGLPYRVVMLCAGDMGFGAAKTYDLEVWVPSQNVYREISSCSDCGDFQARRMKVRFKDENGKNRLVHTLNGSGLAVGRTLLAVLENFQQADGSVVIPEPLIPFMGGISKINPR